MNKIIYEPKGRAGEYGKYALNLYKGCTHGCKYCYVPAFCRLDRTGFHADVEPAPDALKRLEKDLKRVGVVPEPIFLCFTCDPYPEDGALSLLTRAAILLINGSGNAVNLLTKGGMRAARDFDLLAMHPGNKIGATLTFIDNVLSDDWEPEAPDPCDRVEMLGTAKEYGIQTWASIEPVIMPSQSLAIMEFSLPYVDEFKVGKWNHDDRSNKINWKKFYDDVREMQVDNPGKVFTYKQDLLQAAGVKA